MALVGLISKKATLHVQHTFFEHLFAVALHDYNLQKLLRACLRGGRGPQIGEVTCGVLPHLSCKRDQIKMTDYMYRPLPHLTGVLHLHVNRPLVTRFGEEMSYVFSFTFFFTAAHFHLALMAASISHVVTAVRKFFDVVLPTKSGL